MCLLHSLGTSERSTLLHRGSAEPDARTSHVRVLYLFLSTGIFIFPIFIVQYATSNSCITVTPAVTQGLIGSLEVVLVLGHVWFTFRERASDHPADPPARDTSSDDRQQLFPVPFISEQPSKQKLSMSRKVVLFLWVAFGIGSVVNFASDAVGLFQCLDSSSGVNVTIIHTADTYIAVEVFYDISTVFVILSCLSMIFTIFKDRSFIPMNGLLYPVLLAFTILVYLLIWFNTFSSEATKDDDPLEWERQCLNRFYKTLPSGQCKDSVHTITLMKTWLYPMTVEYALITVAICFDLWGEYAADPCTITKPLDQMTSEPASSDGDRIEESSARQRSTTNLGEITVDGRPRSKSLAAARDGQFCLRGFFAGLFLTAAVFILLFVFVGLSWKDDHHSFSFLVTQSTGDVMLILFLILLLLVIEQHKKKRSQSTHVHLEIEEMITIISGMAVPAISMFIAISGLLYPHYIAENPVNNGSQPNALKVPEENLTVAESIVPSHVMAASVASAFIQAVEGTLQTFVMLELAAKHKSAGTKWPLTLEVAVHVITLLNFTFFFCGLVYNARSDAPIYKIQSEVYGETTWHHLLTVVFPLVIFYRFHAATFFLGSLNSQDE